MSRFEYKVSRHEASAFKRLVYSCSETGHCTFNQVPGDQIRIFEDLLNERGQLGWELVQMSFSEEGVLAFWKREVKDEGR
jgi:hypothetical protein